MAFKYRLGSKVISLVILGVLLMGCSGGNKTSSQSSDNNHNNTGGSLVIYAAQPAHASAGTAISITGTGFGSMQGTVNFDTTGAVVTSWSDTSIDTVVPDIAAGSIKLNVVSGTQTAGIDFTLLPFIFGISKTDVILNDTIVITGTGFGATQGGSTIDYAGTVLPVTSWSNNQISASIGNITHAAAGQVNMIVNNAVSNGITLTVHPAISGISPDTGERGGEVSITGNLFGNTQGASSSSFAGSSAVVLSWSDNLIKVRVPDTAVKGDVIVTVNNITSSAQGFTVTKTFYSINQPTGLAMDSVGNIYAANYTNGTIIKVSPGGITQTTLYKGLDHPMGLYYQAPSTLFVACEGDGTVQLLTLGDSVTGYTFASGFSMPAGIAFDDASNMYVTNYGNNSISKMDLSGAVSTFAVGLNKPMGIVFTGPTGGKALKVVNNGNGSISIVDLSGVVTTYITGLSASKYMLSDSAYNLYVTSGNNIIKVLSPSGFIITYATGLSNAYGLIRDSSGYLYVSNFDNNSISKIDSSYEVYAKGLYSPWGITFSPSGTMFIANQGDLSSGGGSISMVTTDGQVLPLINPLDQSCRGFGHISPKGITIGFLGNLFVGTVSDFPGGSTISEVTYDGTASAFGSCLFFTLQSPWGIAFSAGTSRLYITDQQTGEVITMTSSANIYKFALGFHSPEGISIDPSGNVYVANTAGDTVSMVNASGTFTSTYAAGFRQPSGIAFDDTDNLYVSNYAGGSVSLVTSAKQILTYGTDIPAPTGIALRNGVVYVASESEGKVFKLLHRASIYTSGLNMPRGLAKGPDGLIYAADNTNNIIYRLDALDKLTSFIANVPSPSWFVFDSIGTTFLTDFAGGNLLKLSGNNKSVFASGMAGPAGVAYDAMNSLFYVNNYLNGTLSVVSGTGNVSTFAVGLYGPMGVALLSPGNLYVANASNGTIAKVVQGSGVSTFATGFGMPAGITLDTGNNLYVADQSAGMIYVITPVGNVFSFAKISTPFGIAFDGNGNLFVSDTQNKQIKEILLH